MNFERSVELGAARRRILLAALEAEVAHLRQPDTFIETDELDAAAQELADLLRKPETCYACHQEVRSR